MTFKKASKWMSAASLALLLAGCGNKESSDAGSDSGSDFDNSQDIHVISREDGSGTRDAFVEIVEITDADGEDATVSSATIQQGTSDVVSTVSGDEYSIGYISVGSLDESVKALKVDGVEPTEENIASGDYVVQRNLNIIQGDKLSDVAQDFWDFIFSAEGQKIVSEKGAVPVDSAAPEYTGSGMKGQIAIAGSTSVEPFITAISEAYAKHNPDVVFEISATGSSAGVTAAIDGTADIGMASRELDDDESSKVKEVKPLGIDGIAVIVNPNTPIDSISLDTIRGIFLGDITSWADVK